MDRDHNASPFTPGPTAKPIWIRLIVWQIMSLILTSLWVFGSLDSHFAPAVAVVAPFLVAVLVVWMTRRSVAQSQQRTRPIVLSLVIATFLLCELYIVFVAKPILKRSRDLHDAAVSRQS